MSLFDPIYDVIVYGAGHAGVAAVRALHAQGQRVLLLERGPALLWEASWAFAEDASGCDAPEWTAWCGRLAAKGLCAAGRIDGGAVEAEAAALLRAEQVPVLFYATPVAVARDGERISAITVATKNGLRRLTARRWIDASDEGELARICGAAAAPLPSRQRVNIILRRRTWDTELPTQLACTELPQATIRVESTHWVNERRLAIELPGNFSVDHGLWLPVLKAARSAWTEQLAEAVVTHGSVRPLSCWDAAWRPQAVPANMILATPAISGGGWSLGARYALGLAAAAALPGLPVAAADVDAPLSHPSHLEPTATTTADVVVVGAGTGGAFAALTAARAGRRTIAYDPLPFAGGIGSGGGIHCYYWGVRGGLQEEVDDRIRAVSPWFGDQRQVAGFHPEAKKAVLATLLREAGAELRTGWQLAEVARVGRRISTCVLAGPGAVERVTAPTWIDGTGDGDLCALAGAAFRKGRSGDGLLHAFSQSCGRAKVTTAGLVAIHMVNFDAGYCDPTDPEDLSRARLDGCALLTQDRYEAAARPHGISPALGLRQGRQIETETTVTLDDLIMGRRFPDAIGATGSNYDNHACDYQFESTEAAFWVWACQAWGERTWCEIPYGCIVPADLDNCWIASRCLGVSEDAHHSLRMQRDMQRIGEAAGLAAVAAVQQARSARQLDLEPVRAALQASGAMQAAATDGEDVFGRERGRIDDTNCPDLTEAQTGLAMWRWYRRGAAAAEAGLRPLLADPRPGVTWCAAAVLGALGCAAAEPRLLAAVARREEERWVQGTRRNLVPVWWSALAMLRPCATPAALPVLHTLLADTDPGFHHRVLVLQIITGIAGRHPLTTEQRALAAETVARAERWQTGPHRRDPAAPLDAPAPAERPATDRRAAVVDLTWQWELTLRQVGVALAPAAQGGAGRLTVLGRA